MNNTGQIRLLKNYEVDHGKWEACLEKSSLGKLYAKPWFLDIVAPGWQGLVFGDYEFVMPLPVRSKYGIRYVFQPSFCQQLGIYPNPPVEIQKMFASVLKKSFWLVSSQLNSSNDISAFEGYVITEKTNFLLPLDSPYRELYSNYAGHTKRNLKTSKGVDLQLRKNSTQVNALVDKNREFGPALKDSDFENLKKLMTVGIKSGKAGIYEAFASENFLCAAAFFVFEGNRIYFLNSFSNDFGRKNMAMYALIDEVIKENAGSGLTFDFEGSIIEGVAWFFKGFGPQPERYFHIYSNRIPLVRKFMK